MNVHVLKEKVIGKIVSYDSLRKTIGYVTINEMLYIRCYSLIDIMTEKSIKTSSEFMISTGSSFLQIPKVEYLGDESKLRVYVGNPTRFENYNTIGSIFVAYNSKLRYAIELTQDNKFVKRCLDKSIDTTGLIKLQNNLEYESLMKLRADNNIIRPENQRNLFMLNGLELINLFKARNEPVVTIDDIIRRSYNWAKRDCIGAMESIDRYKKKYGIETPGYIYHRYSKLTKVELERHYKINKLLSQQNKYMGQYNDKWVLTEELTKGEISSYGLREALKRLSVNRSKQAARISLEMTYMMGGSDWTKIIRSLYRYCYLPIVCCCINRADSMKVGADVTDTYWIKSISSVYAGKEIDEHWLASSNAEFIMNTLISRLYLPIEYYDCIRKFVIDYIKSYGGHDNFNTNLKLPLISNVIFSQFLMYVDDGPELILPDTEESVETLRSYISIRYATPENLNWMAEDVHRYADAGYLLKENYINKMKESLERYSIMQYKEYFPLDIGYTNNVLELSEEHLNELGYTLDIKSEGKKYKTSRENRYTLKLIDIDEKDIDKLKNLGARTIGDVIVLGAIEKFSRPGRNTMIFTDELLTILKASMTIFNKQFATNMGVTIELNASENMLKELRDDNHIVDYYNSGFILYRPTPDYYKPTGRREYSLNMNWATARNISCVGFKTSRYIVVNFINNRLINLKRLSSYVIMSDEHIDKFGATINSITGLTESKEKTIRTAGNLRVF